jgi:glycosyltransferase involved in cell wall biosynthesis
MDASAITALPRVTVIIPTYNWSTVLPYSIGSVLRQSFTDFEVLVIGDGCTDDSEQVVAAIIDPRVRWINLPVNHGHQCAPNNEGLRQARGSIIAYLGHDDLWLPHHLEVMVAAIDAGADVAHSIIHMIGAEGNALRPAGQMLRYQPIQWMPPTGVAHRRIATERVGGWQDYRDLSRDPETDLWLRLKQAGFAFRCVPRLTGVKFPASYRKDIYKKRSSHEQQQWTERILKEDDLEAVEMGKLLVAEEVQEPRKLTLRAVFGALLGQTSPDYVNWLLLSLTRRQQLWGLKPQEKGANVRRRRQFKGLQQPTHIE